MAAEDELGIGRVPLDSEGYVAAFKADDEVEYKAFFQRWGFVVIEDVLTSDECNDSMEEIWREIEQREHMIELDSTVIDGPDDLALKVLFKELLSKSDDKSDPQPSSSSSSAESHPLSSELEAKDLLRHLRWRKVSRDSVAFHISRHLPITWANTAWPGQLRVGILQGYGWANGPCAWHNRQKENVHRIFSSLLGTSHLWFTLDRNGVMRPTTGEHGQEKWRTESKWLHWDMNPWNGKWSLYGIEARDDNEWTLDQPPLRLQGLLNITDTRKEDGGFYTVPGCKHALRAWAERNEDESAKWTQRNFVPVPREDQELYPHVQEIPARAGSLIIWDSRQAHSNHPNTSDRFRVCQYLTMIDAALPIQREIAPEAVAKALPPGFQLSELGERLLGVATWEELAQQESWSCSFL